VAQFRTQELKVSRRRSREARCSTNDIAVISIARLVGALVFAMIAAAEARQYALVPPAAQTVADSGAGAAAFAHATTPHSVYTSGASCSVAAGAIEHAQHSQTTGIIAPSSGNGKPQKPRTRKKHKKAPEAPTRPRTAYLFFSMEQRAKIKREMGDGVSVRDFWSGRVLQPDSPFPL
jgi:hypothetical protein